MWLCQMLSVGGLGSSSDTTGVDGKVYEFFGFVQKMSIASEWVKNGGILPMLCGVVLCINSPGSMKMCGVKRNRFFVKIKGAY